MLLSSLMLESYLKEIKNIIVCHVSSVLQDSKLEKFLLNGSKMIRSRFTILYLMAHNCKISEQILKIIAAGELIHSASLLHDDVIDGAETRRGDTAISKVFTPQISILSGDYLVSKAVDILLELNNIEILSKFNTCVKEMSIAEILQFNLRSQIPSVEEYIDICENKTALLFSSILESCLLYLNQKTEKAANFSKLFGIYFQLKNDFEEKSDYQDKLNNVKNIKDILGIEKAEILSDNYKEKVISLIAEMPQDYWSKELESLINKL